MNKVLRVFILAVACLPALAQNGTVVVYRPGKYVGSALKPSIYVDGNEAGRLKNGRYISLQLAPGKHNLESSMKKAAPLEVDVKPNATVYLEMVILTGNWRGGGRLIPVGEDEAKTALLKLKPSDDKQVSVTEAATAPSQPAPADNPQAEPHGDSGVPMQPANVTVKSTPQGADINVDGKFMGSTPSTIQLSPGEHLVSVEKDGMRPWQRTMNVSAGGSITIDATLEKP
ncbi:MAG: DUF2846 domain-containing protein [Candidatus Sulfotelmatobacter sp.]